MLTTEAKRDHITKGAWKLGRDWELLALTDHYHTAVAIRDALQEGDVQDATQGLEELLDALSRSEERTLESPLIRLMQQIIKWHVQPDRRSGSWVATINEQRRQMRHLQQRHPRFTELRIRDTLWEHCLLGRAAEAASDMDREHIDAPPLTWQDVFEADYRLQR